MKRFDVVIVGAGMAGLAAANELIRRGIHDFVILESADRIGGRIHAFRWDDGLKLNAGAHWIAGFSEQHPLKPMFDFKKCKMTDFQGNVSVYAEDGSPVDAVDFFATIDETRIAVESVSKDTVKQRDRTARTALDEVGFFPTTPIEMLQDWVLTDFEFTAPPDECSLHHIFPSPYSMYGSSDQMMLSTPTQGAEAVYAPLATPDVLSRVLVDKRVTQIKDVGSRGVDIVCDDSTTFNARLGVIVTTSIGVLTRKCIEFSPPMSPKKLEAIYRYTMTTYEVIIVEFPEVFWKRDADKQCIYHAHSRRGYYPFIHNLYPYYERPILEFHLTHVEAHRVVSQDVAKTKEEIMGVLRNIYGSDIPDPTRIVCTGWSKDPNFYGSYTNWPVEMSKDDYKALRMAEWGGKLRLAGEGIHETQNGYMHGAYLTGIYAAKKMSHLTPLQKVVRIFKTMFSRVIGTNRDTLRKPLLA